MWCQSPSTLSKLQFLTLVIWCFKFLRKQLVITAILCTLANTIDQLNELHFAGLSKQLTTLRQHQRRFSFQFEFASALLQVPTLKAGASLIEHPTIYNATKRILTSIKSSHRKHLSLGRTFCSRRGHGMATAVGKSGEEKETHRSAMITGVASKSGAFHGTLLEAFL